MSQKIVAKMTEIKFRAWDKVSQGFVYFTVKLGDEVFLDPTRYDEELYLCTGLHDKADQEIYGGDIVRESITDGIGAVHYEDGTWYYGEDDFIANYEASDLEIIGNTRVNPSLVE